MNPGWRIRVGRISFILLSCSLCLFPPAGGTQGQDRGQGTLLKARVEVDLPTSQGAIPVLSIYTLRPNRGAREIPLSLLSPEPIRLLSLRALIDGREMETDGDEDSPPFLVRVREHYWEGTVQLQPEAPGPRDSINLQISYVVEGGWDEDQKATIPLVVPRWVPFEPIPETFTAGIAVPEGLTVTGSFPTSVFNKPEAGRAGHYDLGLQGVPAMLILRTEIGNGSPLTLERILDLFVVLILLVIGAAGVRYLRREDG